jgi:hypothetical protein
MNAKNQAIIKMKKPDFVKEHKHLLKVLKTGKGAKKEYKEQAEELKKYK